MKFLLLILFFVSDLEARPKNVSSVADKKCLKEYSGSPSDFGVKVVNGEGEEENKLIARAIYTLSNPGAPANQPGSGGGQGPSADYLKGTTIHFKHNMQSKSNPKMCLPGYRSNNTIFLARSCTHNGKKMNMEFRYETLIHELCHQIGNQKGFYGKFDGLSTRCKGITEYAEVSPFTGGAHKGNNEEFAEVCSAFVQAPDLFKENCSGQEAFWNEVFGVSSDQTKAACNGSGQGLPGNGGNLLGGFDVGEMNVGQLLTMGLLMSMVGQQNEGTPAAEPRTNRRRRVDTRTRRTNALYNYDADAVQKKYQDLGDGGPARKGHVVPLDEQGNEFLSSDGEQ